MGAGIPVTLGSKWTTSPSRAVVSLGWDVMTGLAAGNRKERITHSLAIVDPWKGTEIACVVFKLHFVFCDQSIP